MNVLLIGGAGFIGSHLADKLLCDVNTTLVCVDNLYLGTQHNIEHLLKNKRFIFAKEDARSFEQMDRLFSQYKFDMVYHLAANSDIQASANNPEIEFTHTFQTTYTLLECMRRHNVKNLFFSSTSAVYGMATDKPFTEESELNPISYYGGAKTASEAFIKSYSYMNNLNTMLFRFPNVIGPRLTHGVIFDFIKKLKQNPSELVILGDGCQRKPYIYVQDLVDAISFMTANITNGVSIYNIGVEGATQVKEIADIVVNKLQLKDVKYTYTGGQGGWHGDVPFFQYNLSKIHNTGWKATLNSTEAVIKTVDEVIQ